MVLLLQLNANLPEHFPDRSDRRLYLFSCRRRTCRRKDGCVRALRCSVGTEPGHSSSGKNKKKKSEKAKAEAESSGTGGASAQAKPAALLGNSLFGVGAPTTTTATATGSLFNPFSTSQPVKSSNPFATAPAAAPTSGQTPDSADTPSTVSSIVKSFSDAVQLNKPAETKAADEKESKTTSSTTTAKKVPSEPWPAESSFPPPYPQSFLDAEYETLSTTDDDAIPGISLPSNLDTLVAEAEAEAEAEAAAAADSGRTSTTKGGKKGGNNSTSGDNDGETAFESAVDKTFQTFARRIGQNAEQVLRYEFGGLPLLYTRDDPAGKLLGPGVSAATAATTAGNGTDNAIFSACLPKCQSCGSARKFEMQLMPHAITALEENDNSSNVGGMLDGMDWGTVIVGVCGRDCIPDDAEVVDPTKEAGTGGKAKGVKVVGYVDEFVAVQWEELVSRK